MIEAWVVMTAIFPCSRQTSQWAHQTFNQNRPDGLRHESETCLVAHTGIQVWQHDDRDRIGRFSSNHRCPTTRKFPPLFHSCYLWRCPELNCVWANWPFKLWLHGTVGKTSRWWQRRHIEEPEQSRGRCSVAAGAVNKHIHVCAAFLSATLKWLKPSFPASVLCHSSNSSNPHPSAGHMGD